jgi:hypothetical protein
MRWRKKWTEKPSQLEMALCEVAGHRLIEFIGGGGPIHYAWVRGGTCTVTSRDGTTRRVRPRRRVGTG